MPNKQWKLNEVTFSPFRKEENESFLIGNRKGNLSFIDFGDTNLRGSCFDFVKMLYSLSGLDEVLKKIDYDFGLGIASGEPTNEYKAIKGDYRQPEIRKAHCLIQVETRKFTNEELQYWNDFHQSLDDLRANNIYSIKNLYLNRSKFPLKDTELRFGYLYSGHWKIYRPYGTKKEKWVPNNTLITEMDGKENIKNCEVAFINKSKKDYMVVKKVFPCSCAIQNEGIACFSTENVDFLKSNSKTQILGFDSDVTGVANSQQITKLFDFGYCNVPRAYLKEGIKDFADLAKAHGLQEVEKVLKDKGLIKIGNYKRVLYY
jgi:hypothetical protein